MTATANVPVGSRFGQWVVLGPGPEGRNEKTWKVRCTGCRQHFIRQARSLKRGESTSCKRCAVARARAARPRKPVRHPLRPRTRDFSFYIARCAELLKVLSRRDGVTIAEIQELLGDVTDRTAFRWLVVIRRIEGLDIEKLGGNAQDGVARYRFFAPPWRTR